MPRCGEALVLSGMVVRDTPDGWRPNDPTAEDSLTPAKLMGILLFIKLSELLSKPRKRKHPVQVTWYVRFCNACLL